MIILGLDGAVPHIFLEGLRKGKMPNLARLLKKGVFARALPHPSNVTPVDWSTIATGALPATHGISDFSVHLPERRFGAAQIPTFSSESVHAELFWDALSGRGMKCATISFPGSFPRTSKHHLAIGDDGFPKEYPGRNVIEKARVLITKNVRLPDPYRWKEWETISIAKVSNWKNIPSTFTPAGETTFRMLGRNMYGLLGRKANDELFVLSPERNYKKALLSCAKHSWSEWASFPFVCDRKRTVADFRIRVVDMSAAKKRLHLYVSSVSRRAIGEPRNAARVLRETLGPYGEALNISKLATGGIDDEGMLDEFRYQGLWHAEAALHLVNRMGYKAVFTKWHAFDKFYHPFFHTIDPVSPLHQPKEYVRYETIHQRILKIADEMIGVVLDGLKKDTVFCAVSDHGLMASAKKAWVNNYFVKHGIIRMKKGWKHDEWHRNVDWKRTKAVMLPFVIIWVNLKGRNPGGWVRPGPHYESVRDEIITLLRDWKDPETGRHVMAEVFRTEDGAFYGLGGRLDGDVRFFTTPGYSVYRSSHIARDDTLITPVTFPYTGDHGNCKGTVKFGRGSETAMFAACGGDLKRGIMRGQPIRLCDVLPTLCRAAGLEPPADSEGAVLQDLLEGR
jgi:predicted AlkP superfamily phosphohydrolase/phosphomutase